MDSQASSNLDADTSTHQLLWSVKTVVQKTGLSRASIYRYVSRNLFPPPLRIGPNRVAWVVADVKTWIRGCPMGKR